MNAVATSGRELLRRPNYIDDGICPTHGHEHQPREQAVPCTRCSTPARPVPTYNHDAVCMPCKLATGNGCRG